MYLYADVQGFFNNDFIPKELSVTYDGVNLFTYLFKPLRSFHCLTSEEKHEVHWLERNHHKLKYSDGHIPIGEARKILQKFPCEKVYVKGHQKQIYLQQLFHCEVINVERSYGIPLKYESTYHNCVNHLEVDSVCSRVNVINLYNTITTYM